jgi:2-polyprenyl-3-methyl-5-hydroxy-6-metoxy-1,4-benzoquinol methylase
MSEVEITERQQREREYYDKFSKLTSPGEASFDPILGKELRPWNPYWYLCQSVLDRFRSSNQRLLDFGCGPGAYSLIFAKVGFDVYGFDISPNNVILAQQRAKDYGFDARTHFSTGVGEHLDYPTESFDVVIGVDILHHVNIEPCIKETLRVLRRGGVAIFKEPVEVPIFDPIRNSAFGKWLVPKHASFERHITEDERKLSPSDLKMIVGLCPSLQFAHFRLLSRLDLFIRRGNGKGPSTLEILDWRLLKILPILKRYGGDIVFTLTKE